MLTFTTSSGAEYAIDTEAYKAVRLDGPHSEGIDYDRLPDGFWHRLVDIPDVEIGHSVTMQFVNGRTRVTTPVVKVEAHKR